MGVAGFGLRCFECLLDQILLLIGAVIRAVSRKMFVDEKIRISIFMLSVTTRKHRLCLRALLIGKYFENIILLLIPLSI